MYESVLDIRIHYKPTETFQYTPFSLCHPPGAKKGFIKGEALRLLRTNSTKTAFEEKNQTPTITSHWEVIVENRKQALQPEPKTNKKNSCLLRCNITQQYQTFKKQILMKHWHLIEEQPLLKEIQLTPGNSNPR